jgi:hypothetical protein
MASVEAMAVRTAHAVERADRAASVLAAEFGVELPERPRKMLGNPGMNRVFELEYHAAVLELLVASFGRVAETASGVDPTVLDGTVAEVKAYVAEVEDRAALDMLYAAELAGKDRAGVKSAIDARREEIDAAAGSEE